MSHLKKIFLETRIWQIPITQDLLIEHPTIRQNTSYTYRIARLNSFGSKFKSILEQYSKLYLWILEAFILSARGIFPYYTFKMELVLHGGGVQNGFGLVVCNAFLIHSIFLIHAILI